MRQVSADVWEVGVVPGRPGTLIVYTYDPAAAVRLGTYDLNNCSLSVDGASGRASEREVVEYVRNTRAVRVTITFDPATGFPLKARFFESPVRRPSPLVPSNKVGG